MCCMTCTCESLECFMWESVGIAHRQVPVQAASTSNDHQLVAVSQWLFTEPTHALRALLINCISQTGYSHCATSTTQTTENLRSETNQVQCCCSVWYLWCLQVCVCCSTACSSMRRLNYTCKLMQPATQCITGGADQTNA